MSLSIEPARYKKKCEKVFDESSDQPVTIRSVRLFNRYIKEIKAWKKELKRNQDTPNPFLLSDNWNDHIRHLSSCLEQRVRTRRAIPPRIRNAGHDFMIHVLIMHYFFLSVLRSLDGQKMSKLTLDNITPFATMRGDYEKDSMLRLMKDTIASFCGKNNKIKECLLYSLNYDEAIRGEKVQSRIEMILGMPEETSLESFVQIVLLTLIG